MFVYACGLLLPLIVAVFRSDLLGLLGLPVYAVSFWTGPFVSAAAVIWSGWSLKWRAVWILLVPVILAAALGAVVVVQR